MQRWVNLNTKKAAVRAAGRSNLLEAPCHITNLRARYKQRHSITPGSMSWRNEYFSSFAP
jgi:hypothetical protein